MSHNSTGMQRIFLVGCPRSGTTLLQSLLASHSRIVSFPETHLFSETVPIHKTARFLKIYSTGSFETLAGRLQSLGLPAEELPSSNGVTFRTEDWIERVLTSIDALAVHSSITGETAWLEKTPRHLHYAELIGRVDPSVKFIHLHRRGEHVVPSLYLATQKNPEKWSGARSIRKCVQWWNRSVRLSARFLGEPNHKHVSYRQLVNETETVMKAIFQFLGLPFEKGVLDSFYITAETLIDDGECWKQKNKHSEIKETSKLKRLTEAQRQYIRDNLIGGFPFKK